MRDPILDDPNIFNTLLHYKPKALQELLRRNDQELFELHRRIKVFRERGGDQTTNLKCEYRFMWAYWQRMLDWREAYRYSTTVSDRRGDLADWNNIRLLVEDGYMEHDLLDDDRKRLCNTPMYGLFADPVLGIELPKPVLLPKTELVKTLSRFDAANGRHTKGMEIIENDLKIYDLHCERDGIENWSEAARQYLARNGDLASKMKMKKPDQALIYAGTVRHADTKTSRWMWECSVAVPKLLVEAKYDAVLFFVFDVDAHDPYRGALFARDVVKDAQEIELRHKPGWSAAEYFDMDAFLRKEVPHASIRECKTSPDLSNDPLIKVTRSAVRPLHEFMTDILKVKLRRQ